VDTILNFYISSGIIKKINRTFYLFHSHNRESDLRTSLITINKPTWFSESFHYANSYTNKDIVRANMTLSCFRTKRHLNLIDITNNFFLDKHGDFINKLNNEIPYTDNIYSKIDISSPIGLPTKNLVNKHMRTPIPNFNADMTPEQIDIFNDNLEYYNSQRLSYPESDQKFVDFLIRNYPMADGYICGRFPTIYHKGDFGPEICIFKPLTTLDYLGETLDGVKFLLPQSGGRVSNVCVKACYAEMYRNSDKMLLAASRQNRIL
jgi:hypothetical protein